MKSLIIPVCFITLLSGVFVRAADTNSRSGQVSSEKAFSSDSKVEPAAQKLLGEVEKAYENLKSLETSGKISVIIDAPGEKENTNEQFSSSFQAPAKFQHTTRDGITLGSTGEKVYVYNPSNNAYLWLDPLTEKVSMRNLPPLIPRILQSQNPSLLFALSKTPVQEVVKSFDEVKKIEDLKIGTNSFPALEFDSKDDQGRITLAIEPDSHLIRQFSLDFTPALEKSGATNVKSAMIRVDYTTIKPNVDFATNHFAWAPPANALDLHEAAGAQRPEPDAKSTLMGRKAADFNLKNLDGKNVNLADLKGQVVVLEFWATWSPPCAISLPLLEDLSSDNQNVKVFAINIEEDKDKVKTFLDLKKIDVPVLLDERSKISKTYEVHSLPQTVVIGKDGIIKEVLIGLDANSDSKLRSAIQAAQSGK